MLALVLALAVSAHPGRPGPLPFVHDDWPAALELARSRDLPIFVEAWAPW